MGNVRLKKRLQRRNTKGRKVFYWPRVVSQHKNLEPGTHVYCLEDAIGDKPKLVKVARVKDTDGRGIHGQYETFVVLLEDLTE